MTDSLFPELDPVAPPPTEKDWRTAAQRRRDRIAAAIAHGYHPLSLLFPHLQLHPDPTLTCGSCIHRQQVHGGNRSYPKCLRDMKTTTFPADRWGRTSSTTMPYASHGSATDILASWPACTHHQGEPDA